MGFDGSSYEYPKLDEFDEKIIGVDIWHKPEGKICKRLTKDMEKISPNFIDQLFYLYRRPAATVEQPSGWGRRIRQGNDPQQVLLIISWGGPSQVHRGGATCELVDHSWLRINMNDVSHLATGLANKV